MCSLFLVSKANGCSVFLLAHKMKKTKSSENNLDIKKHLIIASDLAYILHGFTIQAKCWQEKGGSHWISNTVEDFINQKEIIFSWTICFIMGQFVNFI